MAEDPENIVLMQLREMRAESAAFVRRWRHFAKRSRADPRQAHGGVIGIKGRVRRVEEGMESIAASSARQQRLSQIRQNTTL